ncbi:MAG: LytTR family DNA-binding domain-containing protein [Salinivirgaceae bacterium]|jgi:DNA-binding LytR/AlgR family response regulator|nr:LytTR family DNA-binding domain-containing protein [Salinivirgaceae bacterium]
MKILIVEDEPLAAEKLEAMLYTYDATIVILAVCSSVESAVRWLKANSAPDLGLFDIQLGDGNSFEIFEKVSILFPVIFTTAFDQFALKAFKVNSVDYLLKPIEEKDLSAAMEKYTQLHFPAGKEENIFSAIDSVAKMMHQEKKYRDRFVIAVGERLKMINSADIVCFYSEDKSTFLLTSGGRCYPLDQSLNQLEEEINPKLFFRTNRSEIVNIQHISDIVTYGGTRLKISIPTKNGGKELIVSRERTKSFRNWLSDPTE